jgi:preprotein translocase subunit SecG
MWGIVTFVHVLVSVLMVMVILLQTGKGAEIGAAFGGGYSQTLFGSAGPVGFLNKLTTVVATFFMLTSLLLAFLAAHAPAAKSLVDKVPQQEAPVVPGQVPGGK